MSDTSMNDILSDAEVETKEVPAVEETKELPLETKEEVVETPEAPAEEVAEAPESMVPQAALHEERKRRQEERKRYEDLQAEVNKLLPHLATGQKPQEAAKPPVSFNEDPEGYMRHAHEEQSRLVEAKFMDMSEASARRRHEDYDAMLSQFAKLAKEEPALISRMQQQLDPAEWAYRTAKQASELAEMGDPVAFRERTKAELLAEIKAEQEAAEAESSPDLSSIPKTLGKARNTGTRAKPAWSGPDTLDEILK